MQNLHRLPPHRGITSPTQRPPAPAKLSPPGTHLRHPPQPLRAVPPPAKLLPPEIVPAPAKYHSSKKYPALRNAAELHDRISIPSPTDKNGKTTTAGHNKASRQSALHSAGMLFYIQNANKGCGNKIAETIFSETRLSETRVSEARVSETRVLPSFPGRPLHIRLLRGLCRPVRHSPLRKRIRQKLLSFLRRTFHTFRHRRFRQPR